MSSELFLHKPAIVCDNIKSLPQERDAAARMFKGKKGQQLVAEVGKKSKTFVPGEKLPDKQAAPSGPSKEDIDAIKVRDNLIMVTE